MAVYWAEAIKVVISKLVLMNLSPIMTFSIWSDSLPILIKENVLLVNCIWFKLWFFDYTFSHGHATKPINSAYSREWVDERSRPCSSCTSWSLISHINYESCIFICLYRSWSFKSFWCLLSFLQIFPKNFLFSVEILVLWFYFFQSSCVLMKYFIVEISGYINNLTSTSICRSFFCGYHGCLDHMRTISNTMLISVNQLMDKGHKNKA